MARLSEETPCKHGIESGGDAVGVAGHRRWEDPAGAGTLSSARLLDDPLSVDSVCQRSPQPGVVERRSIGAEGEETCRGTGAGGDERVGSVELDVRRGDADHVVAPLGPLLVK